MANAVVLTQPPYSYDVGGEFNAVTSPDNFLPNYSPQAIVGNGFQTFCVETRVDFYPTATYSYTLSDVAVGDPVTGPVDLSKGAAFLYYQFAKGILPGYDYTDPDTRKADAGELQSALWWFQGGQTYGGYPDPITDPFYIYAVDTLGLQNADAPNNGAYGVDVLQMWSGDLQPAQNQLVLVPDNTSTLLLLGAGLGVVMWTAPRLRTAPARRGARRGRQS